MRNPQKFETHSLEVLSEIDSLAQNPSAWLGTGIPIVIGASGHSLVGVIEEIQSHQVTFIVKEVLSEGCAISIEFGATCLEGEIVSSRSIGTEYLVCATIPNINNRDRRAAERLPLTQEVQIWRAESDLPLDGVVVDLSARGMGLELSVHLENNETVMVESISCSAFAAVRHCRPLSDGRVHAGVEVFHVMPKQGD